MFPLQRQVRRKEHKELDCDDINTRCAEDEDGILGNPLSDIAASDSEWFAVLSLSLTRNELVAVARGTGMILSQLGEFRTTIPIPFLKEHQMVNNLMTWMDRVAWQLDGEGTMLRIPFLIVERPFCLPTPPKKC